MRTASQSTYFELRTATRLADLPADRIRALAKSGTIRVRDVPGVRARYLRQDVEALAAAPACRDAGPLTNHNPDSDSRPAA